MLSAVLDPEKHTETHERQASPNLLGLHIWAGKMSLIKELHGKGGKREDLRCVRTRKGSLLREGSKVSTEQRYGGAASMRSG